MLGKFPTPTCIEDVLDQPVFLNSLKMLNFCSNNPFFCPKQKYVRQILPSLVSNVNHERMYKLIMDLIPNYWKHMPQTETSKINFKNFLL